MYQTLSLANPAVIILIGIVTLVIPLLAIVTTSFVRFVIVLNLLRQAIGAQSVPPSFVLNVIAVAPTVTVMTSPASAILDVAARANVKDMTYARGVQLANDLIAPLVSFMKSNTGKAEMDLMEDIRNQKWTASARDKFKADSIFVVLPAFVMSEVRRGFELGFLIYIPFVIIDVVIATLTTAMGMSSVSPNIIALPLKLLFFVYIDGWSKLAHTLISGYF